MNKIIIINKSNQLNKFIKIIMILTTVSCLFINCNALYAKKYTLKECISLAVTNNYDLLYANYQKDYSEANLKSAWGAYLPNLNLNASYSHILNNTNELIKLNSYTMNALANILIFDGFGREANYKLAKQSVELSDLQHKYLTEQLKLNVYTQFVNITRLKETAKARKQDIEKGKADLENLKGRVEAGIVPMYMLLSQEAELGNKEILLLDAEIDINTAKQNLLKIMGLDPASDADFDETDIITDITQNEITNFRNSIGNLQNSIDTAFKNRIDYTSSMLSKESAEISKGMSNALYYPTLSASLGYYWQNSEFIWKDHNQATVGLNLTVPIFNNFNTDLRVQQAELTFQQENINLMKLEQNIRAEVQTAYFNLESREKALLISEKALAAAEQNFQLFTEKLNIGNATITDYITANSQYITAQINNITSIYAYISARKNLLFTIGKYE